MKQKVITFNVEELQSIMFESDDGVWQFYTKNSTKQYNMVPYTILMKQKIMDVLNVKNNAVHYLVSVMLNSQISMPFLDRQR